MTDDLELKELEMFRGTEQYHKGFMGVKLTDGVAYVVNNGYSWLVSDFSVVAKMKPVLKAEEFLTVELKLDGKTGKMVVTDGNEKTLYTQEYGYTSAKREFKMFYTDGVLMLAGEY